MGAWEKLALVEGHGEACLGEKGSGGAAGRPTTDYYDVNRQSPVGCVQRLRWVDWFADRPRKGL